MRTRLKCQMWRKRGKVNLNMCVNKNVKCVWNRRIRCFTVFMFWCNNICILVKERLLRYYYYTPAMFIVHTMFLCMVLYIWMNQKRNAYMFTTFFFRYLCRVIIRKRFALSSAFAKFVSNTIRIYQLSTIGKCMPLPDCILSRCE